MAETNALNGLLKGKKGLIVGVANQNSIAWACAKALAGAGMDLAFTFQGETFRDRIARTTAEIGEVPLFDMDVQDDAQIEAVVAGLRERWGRLDFLLHSVAFAPKEAMTNPFIETSRDAFLKAHDISAYSLVGLTRAVRPLMSDGGSVVTMSYFGAEKVVPNYNIMGVAKASLEASVRYLAANLGEENIRVNAISAGAINTLAARGVAHFRDLLKITADRAPLKRPIEPNEVGNAALFLASDLSSGITGETMYVDAGFNITAG
ncbi:MAG TPA: enoyl-ACP reductase [Longimicrobiaceae bacterium]|nr:enoyl-ACP reductase [Longimicrobiaceae bacterium]